MSTRAVAADDPAAILRLGTAFCDAKAVLTAIEVGLFDTLHKDGPADTEEICARLGLHPRGTGHFLDLLSTLGLLVRAQDRYGNSPAADRYLVRSDPSYIGGFLERANHNLYPAWGRLTQALRTGEQQSEVDYTVMIEDPKRLRRFLDMMDALTNRIGPLLAEAVDFTGVRTVVDVGGARGNLLSHLLKAHPQLAGTVFDLPVDAQPCAEHAYLLGLEDRLCFQPGDFFADPLPSADMIIIGHVLHDWAPEQRRALVGKAQQALHPGGLLVVYDPMIDEELSHPENLVVSLDMLLTTAGGSEYTAADCTAWMTGAGLRVETVRPLGDSDTLVTARKAAHGDAGRGGAGRDAG